MTLSVVNQQNQSLLQREVAEGESWCLHWHHSVAGFLVRDCFVIRDGQMILDSSEQPDFAAGLGHIEGRGVVVNAGPKGYRIQAINEPVPHNRLNLRVGAMRVNHRMVFQQQEISLSTLAAGQRVSIQLTD